jgi:hypothetical protein
MLLLQRGLELRARTRKGVASLTMFVFVLWDRKLFVCHAVDAGANQHQHRHARGALDAISRHYTL